MRTLLNAALLVLISLAISRAQGATGHVNGEVWYRPFVRDINGFENRALAKCEVLFQSNGIKKQTVTDEKGRYSVDLPGGTYDAKASCPAYAGMTGEFNSSERSDFVVQPDKESLINLIVSIKHIPKKSAPNGDREPEYRRSVLKSESLEFKTPAGQARKILVRYALRSSSRELAEYQGKRDSRQDTPVSITFESLAIYADRVSIEKPKLHVHASGHLVIEDGKQRRQGNEATIEFDAADPITTIKFVDKPATF